MAKVTPQNRSAIRATPSIITKGIGVLFVLSAALIALSIRNPTKTHYFIIYALIGLGIALLLRKSADRANATIKTWNLSVVLAGGVALPFILFFTNPIGTYKEGNDDLPLSVTVFVHGSKSRQDMILRQQGHVLMDVTGGERKRSDITENGAAYFQNLHVGDSVRLEVDFSEPYRAIVPDSVYIVKAESRIYLPVALQGIDKVEGIVFFNEDPLEGVQVKIGNLIDTSDRNGDFVIAIPKELQRKEYKVWFRKKGYKTKSAPAFPQTGQPLEIVMEK